MTLIIGGSGSGKSSYAEDYISKLSEGKNKYYLATMQVFDKEGQKKIDRHHRLRSGKDFVTIEQPRSIHEALGKMDVGEKNVLLECMSNLVANEMFLAETSKTKDMVIDKILRDMKVLDRVLKHFVVVSNNVFEDGITYEATTMEYIKALGLINERLALMANEVVEVVVGIPLVLKGR